jgi:hypothetical protein
MPHASWEARERLFKSINLFARRHKNLLLFLIWAKYGSGEDVTPLEWNRLDPILDLLDEACSRVDSRRVRRLRAIVIGWESRINAGKWLNAVDRPVR